MSDILPFQVDETDEAIRAAQSKSTTNNKDKTPSRVDPSMEETTAAPPGSRQEGKIVTGPDGRKIILGPDGKPCKTCNSLKDLLSFSKSATAGKSTLPTPPTTPPPQPAEDFSNPATFPCPPDVETLGRSTWTLLHSLAATYPPRATPAQQTEMRTFLSIFSRIYPCWFCAQDFRAYIGAHEPRVEGREELGRWMCEAHNSVNRKLGKKEFDCRFWEERWREASGGRCG